MLKVLKRVLLTVVESEFFTGELPKCLGGFGYRPTMPGPKLPPKGTRAKANG